jgi:hypothetical protein
MTDTTNAGPVPEIPIPPEPVWSSGLYSKVQAYGRQCWDACDEHVAGPLREELAQVRGYLETLTQRCVDDTAENGALRQRVAQLEAYCIDWNAQVVQLHEQRDALRDRVAELEREVESDRRRVHGYSQDFVDSLRADRDRLRAENAQLIEDRARFPDRPAAIGNMIGAHIGNLKAKADAAEDAYRKVQLSLDVSRAENEALAKALAAMLAHSGVSDAGRDCKFSNDVDAEDLARELLASRAAREGKQ